MSVAQRGTTFEVEITVTDFDRKIRNRIYAKQLDLYREFPAIDFDFFVIDGSPEDLTPDVYASGSSR